MAPDGERYPLQAAAEYAALGLALLTECPLPPVHNCNGSGKRPWDPIRGGHLKGWQTGVPTSGELTAWMRTGWYKVVNIGCRCGPNCLGEDGLIGADADGDQGVAQLAVHLELAPLVLQAALAQYLESGIFAPNLGTAAYVTQSGGLRTLWRAAPGADLRTVGGDKGHEGLRLMWQGSQVVLPPSIGPKGIYRWLPGHAPAQIGFAPAPATVLAAMAPGGRRAAEKARADALWAALPPEARGEVRPTIASADAYPAATDNLGPEQGGRLVDAGWLPYDLDLLREGLPKGQRSEAVRRLALQMLAAGWTVEQVVAALAGQPWIAAMRPNIVGWLTADVLRAEAWRAEQNAQAVGGVSFAKSAEPGTPRPWRPVPWRRDATTPPKSAPETSGPSAGQTDALRVLADALARRLADPTFDLDEALAIAVADAPDPDGLEAGLRQAVADACARWAAQQAATQTGGRLPPKEPGGAASVADDNADGDEPPAESTTKGRKRRGPPAGATVLSPSESELRRWLKAPKRSAQRSGPQEDAATVRLSAPVRLGSVWLRHAGHEGAHAVLRLGDFILRLASIAAQLILYEKGAITVREIPIPVAEQGHSRWRRGCAEDVNRRLQLHLDRLIEGPRFCGKQAVFREAPAVNGRGDLFHVHHSTHAPCGQRGCRRCAEIVAAIEMAEHAERLRLIYGDEPVAVLRCATRGFGLSAAQAAARKLLKSAEVRQAVGGPGVLCGYLCAEAQDGRVGYGLLLVVPSQQEEAIATAVRGTWCRLAPGGTVAPGALPGLPENPNVLEALVVAHVFSDRAVLSAAGAHLVTPEVARAAYGVEVGCDPQHPDAAPLRRWVASPGWRGLLPTLDEIPAGAYLAPGSCPECVAVQRLAASEAVFGDTDGDRDVSPVEGAGDAESTGSGGSEDERLAAMRRAPDVRELSLPGTDITVFIGAPCRWDGEALSEPMWWAFERKPVREFRSSRGADSVLVLVPEQVLRKSGAA